MSGFREINIDHMWGYCPHCNSTDSVIFSKGKQKLYCLPCGGYFSDSKPELEELQLEPAKERPTLQEPQRTSESHTDLSQLSAIRDFLEQPDWRSQSNNWTLPSLRTERFGRYHWNDKDWPICGDRDQDR